MARAVGRDHLCSHACHDLRRTEALQDLVSKLSTFALGGKVLLLLREEEAGGQWQYVGRE